MEKILLALGHRQLEDFLNKQLKNEFKFVGTTVYREGVIRAIGQNNPDIVVIRETLPGKENILSIIYEIRQRFSKIRIIFVGGKRDSGDVLLATLVNYGVYDILHGEKIQAQEIIALIRKPNEYKDVQHLQPVPVLDEKSNQVLFQAPNAIVQEKEIIKEIYIEQGSHAPLGNPQQTTSPVNVNQQEIVDSLPVDNTPYIPIQKEGKKEKKDKKVEITKETPMETAKKSFLDKLKSKSEISSSFGQNMVATTKQKIITFMGSKSGVGTSSIAFNTALSLARKGLKTIYLELNDKTPSVSYWYDLGFVDDGIDSALIALEENHFEKLEEAIVRSADLKKQESDMQRNYKKFPNTLDFMFFSSKYLTRENDELEKPIDMGFSKELFLYLMFQLDYDVIILDVPEDINHPATSNALIYSNKVFMTVSQDVSTIGYSIYKMNELSKREINIDKKLYYVINKFEKSEFNLREIEDWILSKNLITVPILNKDFINANYLGLPVILYSKDSGLRNAFQKIEKMIM